MWYEGGDLLNQWGIQKQVLKTDTELEQAIYSIEDENLDIVESIKVDPDIEADVDDQLKFINSGGGAVMYREWLRKMQEQDDASLKRLLSTKQGREAYERAMHTKVDYSEAALTEIPPEVFSGFADTTPFGTSQFTGKVDMGNLSDVFKGV